MCFFTTSTITVGKSNKSCVLAQAVLWFMAWFFATHVDRDGRLNLPNKDWSMVFVSHGVATRNTRELESSSVHTENDISILLLGVGTFNVINLEREISQTRLVVEYGRKKKKRKKEGGSLNFLLAQHLVEGFSTNVER